MKRTKVHEEEEDDNDPDATELASKQMDKKDEEDQWCSR